MRIVRNIYLIFKLLAESFAFAYSSVKANKLRTFLSLLGVSVGIFAIISVYTMVDALEKNIREGVETLGSNVVYIEKWPWTPDDGEYKWWEFRQRPEVRFEEFKQVQAQSVLAESVAMYLSFRREIKYRNNTLGRATITGISQEWDDISPLNMEDGRYFTPMENSYGAAVTIIGNQVAQDLFNGENPIGKEIKIAGRKLMVVGLLKKKGSSIVNVMDLDNVALTPINFARSVVDMRRANPSIAVKAKPGVPQEELMGELKMIMRSLRRLKPIQKDNFALNEMSVIQNQLSGMFTMLNLAGALIGGFSILIGGFGIANIMFVSVKERTNIIGIQKALGAKGYFILTQFLFEATLLSVVGGIIGLLIVYSGSFLISYALNFDIQLNVANVLRGLLISGLIGVISGLVPAYMASRLNPVEAINSK